MIDTRNQRTIIPGLPGHRIVDAFVLHRIRIVSAHSQSPPRGTLSVGIQFFRAVWAPRCSPIDDEYRIYELYAPHII